MTAAVPTLLLLTVYTCARSLETLAAVCACCGLASRFEPSLQAMERVLLAGATLLLIGSQSLRMLERSQSLGPLVLMAIRMIEDTRRFLLLITGPIIGFAGGLVVLFKGELAGGLGDDCSVFDDGDSARRHLSAHHEHSNASSYGDGGFDEGDPENVDADGGEIGIIRYVRSAVSLFEVMLGSDNQLGCLRESSHPVTSALFMDAYLVANVLVGANMLIALMAKTFDVFYNAQVQNYMFLTTLLTAAWEKAEAVPPPFALLSLLYHARQLTPSLGMHLCNLCPWISRRGFQHLEGEDSEAKVQVPVELHTLKEAMEKYNEESEGKDVVAQVAHVKAEVATVKAEVATVSAEVAELKAMVQANTVEILQRLDGMKLAVAAGGAVVDGPKA